MLAITQYSTVFSQNLVYFGRKKIALGGIISRCMSGGCPRVLFLRYDDACTGFASCSDPRTVSGRRGVEQCDPQPLLWCSVPAFYIPHTAGGSEGTLCLPSAIGCHSRALRPAVLPGGGDACVSQNTFFLFPKPVDRRVVHRELFFSLNVLPPLSTKKKRLRHITDRCFSLFVHFY